MPCWILQPTPSRAFVHSRGDDAFEEIIAFAESSSSPGKSRVVRVVGKQLEVAKWPGWL
jgi:hypothetical protein